MENKDNLQQLMTNIVSIFGKQVITEKKFVNLLADYRGFEGNRAAKRILNAIVAQKYAALIVGLSTSEFDSFKLKYYAHELSKSDGFNEDIVETIMRMVVFACNHEENPIRDFSIEKRDGKFGCVDAKGSILIPFEYDRMKAFETEFGTHIVCVQLFQQGDVYSTSGELLFRGSGSFFLTNEKGLWIAEKDNKFGAIHPNGEVVIPFVFKRILTVNYRSEIKLLVVETETGVGVIDYKGRQILPPVFEEICNFVDETFGILEAKLSDRYMYFNLDGSVADITPLFCTTPFNESAYNANEHKMPKGYIVDGKKLIISTTHNDITDVSGKIICSLGKFNDGLAVAEESPWVGYMNSSLEFVIREFKFASDSRFDFCEPFSHGFAIVWKNNRRGIINTKGEIVVTPQYENIIRRDWCFILRYSESQVQSYYMGEDYMVGDCYIKAYDSASNFKYCGNDIFDIGNFINGRAFAQYRNFVGIVTQNGETIEPIEYEWFRAWNSPKLVSAKIISPVRRNGVWGELDLEKGFISFSNQIQERNESRYQTKLKEKGHPFPYFLKYFKDYTSCGFKWYNWYNIPAELYDDFIKMKETMPLAECEKWLSTNSVIVH